MRLSRHCPLWGNSMKNLRCSPKFYGKYERRLVRTFLCLLEVVFLRSAFLNLATMLGVSGMASGKDQFVTPVVLEGSRQNQSKTLLWIMARYFFLSCILKKPLKIPRMSAKAPNKNLQGLITQWQGKAERREGSPSEALPHMNCPPFETTSPTVRENCTNMAGFASPCSILASLA